MIDPARITAFDVETKGVKKLYGLQPFRMLTGEAWLTTCAMAYWQDGKIVGEGFVRPSAELLNQWLDKWIAEDNYVVGWNMPFDVAWLLAVAQLHPELDMRRKIYRVRWLDGMLLYRHLINAPRFREEGRQSMGLKPAVERFLPARAGYADDIDYDDESPENIAKLLQYNRRDSAYTLAITCHLIGQLTEQTLRCALIEARSIPDVAETVIHGVKLNPKACEELGVKLEEQRRLSFMTLKMQHPEVSEKILSSPKQLADLMFKQWGLPVVRMTDPTDTNPYGNPSTDKETLVELALRDERAKHIHEYRDAAYCMAKFSVSPIASLAYNGDGVSRPQHGIFRTYTGRMNITSKVGKGAEEEPIGIALHQWKRDPMYREIIEPPEGYDLLEFDFAGQEFRWMAVESGDTQMLQLCQPGEDPHSFMGARIGNVEYRWLQTHAGDDTSPYYKEAKPIRQMGKVGNLSLQYRTSPPTLVRVAATQHKMRITMPTSKRIHATYLTTYRRVPVYWKRQINKARVYGYVETLAGRRVQLGSPDTWKYADGGDATWSHESTAINFPIQGVGGDQKYLAILCAHELCLKYDARFYFELHDGIFFVCPQDRSEAFGHEMKALLSNLPYQRAWGVKLPIQFPVDGKRGPSWGKLKEFH